MTSLDAPVDLDVLLDRALAVGGETAQFDFKATLEFASNGEHKLKLLKAIGAFSNTDHGGYIFVGVSNERRVVGVPGEVMATYDQSRVHRLASEWFAPAPALQVRHHKRDGRELVVLEIVGFTDVPSIVRKTEVQGSEKLQAGTILTRTAAAESAVLTSETEVRTLCDAIASRRAQQIVETVRNLQGRHASSEEPKRRLVEGLMVIRAEADRMAQHARDLNIELHNALRYHIYRPHYLPLLFRSSLLESTLKDVLGEISGDSSVMENLSLLRSAAPAADERAAQVITQDADPRSLIPLVLQVLNAGRLLSDALDRKLKRLATES